MKNVKKIFSLVFIVVAIIALNNTKCLASEVQYTDNVIPKMTSDTSPSGKASASSVYQASTGRYNAYLAFDHRTETNSGFWDTQPYVGTGWLEYEFPDKKCITKYTLHSGYGGLEKSMPKDWTFEAWDGKLNQWVVLDTQINIIFGVQEKKEFKFSNENLYNRYRINISKSYSDEQLSMAEMEMMETVKDSAIKIPKVVLEPNEDLQLSVDDDLVENTKMSWISSDSLVATVDGNGVVVALKPGNTVITCISEDGKYTDTVNVLVVEDAKDYRLAVDLKVGKSCRLTVDDFINTVAVTWTSMDPSVATVSSTGKVTAVSKGLTIITATDDKGNDIGQIYVRVRN